MKRHTLYAVLSCILAMPAYNAFGINSPTAGETTDDLGCTAEPSCASLGYTTDTTCNNGSLIKCPFDTTLVKCIPSSLDCEPETIDCGGLGFTSTDKSEWCSKIVTCPENSTYTLCAEKTESSSNTGSVYCPCTEEAPYYINGECTSVCNAPEGQSCFMCSNEKEDEENSGTEDGGSEEATITSCADAGYSQFA